MPHGSGARRAAAVASVLIPIGAFLHALSYSWQRWGEIAVDWGRELEVARQLAAGRVLYADLHYWYGPLAPYLNAILFTLFGVHTRVLQTAGLCSAALMTALLYAVARHMGGRDAGAAVAVAFVYLCAFGHYFLDDIFNWATPYTYAATYGMLAATMSLYALVRHAEGGGPRWFAVSLACLGLTLLTKLEAMLPALLAHAALIATRRPHGLRAWARMLAPYGVVIVPVAAIVASFTLRAGVASYETSLFSPLNARHLPLILRYMGVSEWPTALPAVGLSALRLGLCLALPAILACRLGPAATPAMRWLATIACAVVPVVSLRGADPMQVLRALPLVAVLAFADTIARRRPAADAILWAFALGALARVPLSAGAYHYGFYLAPVPLAALLLLWFRWLPQRLGNAPLARRLAVTAGGAVVVTLGWTHAQASAAMYALHTAHVSAPRGDLWLLDDAGGVPVGPLYAATIERLRAYPAGTTVLAAPDGAGLAFLAGLSTWHGRFSYYPPETGPSADVQLRGELEMDPPGVIVLLNLLDLSPYGVAGFGRDYATESVGWIQQRYEVDRAFTGNTVVIARPRGAPAPGN